MCLCECVCACSLDRRVLVTGDVSFYRVPFIFFEQRFIRYFTRTSIKEGERRREEGGTWWGFSTHAIQTHAHTQNLSLLAYIHSKFLTSATTMTENLSCSLCDTLLSLSVSNTHTHAHTVRVELASAPAVLKIPPSVLLGLAWGQTWAQAYKCPLCSAVEMSNKWLFY